MNETQTTVATLPCNTATQCAFIRFVREALVLGDKHGIFADGDRHEMVLAIRAADVEACEQFALGVVLELYLRTTTQDAYARWITASYLSLRDLGRQARIIPMS